MKIESRLYVTFLLRLVFLFFAGWVAIAPAAVPGAHVVTRIGLAAAFLVISILMGEVGGLHAQFTMLVRALRAAGANVSSTGIPGTPQAEAIPILIRALGSADPDTREKAERNLVRLTGQDLGSERSAWETWWKDHGHEFG